MGIRFARHPLVKRMPVDDSARAVLLHVFSNGYPVHQVPPFGRGTGGHLSGRCKAPQAHSSGKVGP